MDDQEKLVSGPRMSTAALIVLGGVLSGLAALVVLSHWLPVFTASLAGRQPKAYWELTRASGMTAYALLWLSIVLGLSLSGKVSRVWPGGPTAADLHQFASLLALAFATFHGLILLGDRYIGYTPAQILLPFARSSYRPLWVGMGQVAFYLAAIVAFSVYLRRWIGYHAWRLLHFTSFAIYLLVTAHALGAGTDSRTPLAVAIYGSGSLVICFMTAHRITVSTRVPRPVHG
ncbi:MAG TPA: ferric reductase-like transmembrane domain-containing protein [bacterium]|nr:ferric reductase-like transmembrane domain-containing protein [bacterium]